MSWLPSSSLSGLREQLSELTRDVIQETDADRSLLEADRELEARRIRELERVEERQKEEIKSLMENNLTMQDRVDAAELQAATVSREFRNIIVSLQEELNGVKLENKSLKELFRDQSYLAADSESGAVKIESESGSDQELKKQISDLERELRKQADEHREQMSSVTESPRTVKRANNPKSSHSPDERGRGDGVDGDNGESDQNSDAQLVEVGDVEVATTQQNDSNRVESSEAKSSHSLEIALSKERTHKERLLKHLEDISAEHDQELMSLMEDNNKLKEELEGLRLRVAESSTGVSEREVNSVSTQTIPHKPVNSSDRPADNSFVQGGEIGWLKDEVKNLTSKLRSSSLEVESMVRERETKRKVLQNLQLTVRQVERENDTLRTQSVATWREQLRAHRDQSERLKTEVEALRARCEGLERERSHQLTASDVYSAVTAGGREMSGPHEYLEAELLRIKAELHRLVSEKNEMVSRDQARGLLMQYATAPPNSKDSAIQAISALLDIPAEERGILNESKHPRVAKQRSNSRMSSKSFSQLFIEFLMQESGPPQPANTDSMGSTPVMVEPVSNTMDRDERPSLATATLGPTPADISKVMTTPLPKSVATYNNTIVS